MIRFNFDKAKFIALMQIICQRATNVDMLKALKLLYLLDREFLLIYGRPILGDTYIRMDLGPVPSKAYDYLKGIEDNSIEGSPIYSEEAFKYPLFKAKSDPDMELFSEAEIDFINETIDNYGKLSGIELSNITHKHKAWTDSERNLQIDYRLFFADDPEKHQHALEAMILEQEDRDFADNL